MFEIWSLLNLLSLLLSVMLVEFTTDLILLLALRLLLLVVLNVCFPLIEPVHRDHMIPDAGPFRHIWAGGAHDIPDCLRLCLQLLARLHNHLLGFILGRILIVRIFFV